MSRPAPALRAVALAAATTVASVACLPFGQHLVPAAPGSDDYHLPITAGEIVLPVVLALLCLAGGWWFGSRGGVLWTAGAISLPAVVVYSVSWASAESIGANMWIIGTVVSVPVLLLGSGVLALAGLWLRRLADRRKAA
ncbi:hypothetical protein QEZ54_13170 [Catellatospora sp. KI3]|uniref:hypothetical protein n=1 Tax=Catellatospora sp. KI3 TaxID=3041620 RepID=UPI0024822304|nr:hypothetical protein [Catellatospora sp. KI3]MDI1461922.1 hypothetical protein [Catellatospora sp. KI3]